jgi:hypothetical protein
VERIPTIRNALLNFSQLNLINFKEDTAETSNTETFLHDDKYNKDTAVSGEAVGLSTISQYISYPKERGMRGDGPSRQNHRANS